MFYLVVLALFLCFLGVVLYVAHWRGVGWKGKVALTVFLICVPFWDIFIAKGILLYHSMTASPLQRIEEVVESPSSVYWVDEVWPGFNEYGSYWMVKNYLDGVNLNMLALKGEDEKTYVYRASLDDFLESEKLRPDVKNRQREIAELKAKAIQMPRQGQDNSEVWKKIREELEPVARPLTKKYEQLREEEIRKIIDKVEVYTPGASLPQFKYTVVFQRIRLPAWQERFVWCDLIRIQDNEKDKEVAHSRRYLSYTPMTSIRYEGNSPFENGERLGDVRAYTFDDKVLFGYAGVKETETNKSMLRRNNYQLASIRWQKKNKTVVIEDAK